MAWPSNVALFAVMSYTAAAGSGDAVMELSSNGNVQVSGSREQAKVSDLQKFFPKIKKEKKSLKDDGPDEFVDDIASGLDDASADLLVADQDPSKVCARDIKRFCGDDAMKEAHPLHCLGSLEEEDKKSIHKLCRVHVENSLSFTCARDMIQLNCDPVFESTLDCLARSLDSVSQDCADQVRLTSHVMLKVNNANVKVKAPINDTHLIETVHDREISEGWVCGHNFWPHPKFMPCCKYMPDRRIDCAGKSEFKCAESKCASFQGQWLLKQDITMPQSGHLCCPPSKSPTAVVQPKNIVERTLEKEGIVRITKSGDTVLTSQSRKDLFFIFLVCAVVGYWKREFLMQFAQFMKGVAKGDVDKVELPGLPAIELTQFFKGTAEKKVPEGRSDGKGMSLKSGGYGGL